MQKADLTGSVFFVETVLHGGNKSGTDDTGGDGEHGNADEADEGAENTAYGSDRIDITVADCCKSDDGPPHAVTDILEYFRLCSFLDEVYQYRRKTDDYQAGGKRGQKFGAH